MAILYTLKVPIVVGMQRDELVLLYILKIDKQVHSKGFSEQPCPRLEYQSEIHSMA